jgi:hypothetical protein
MVRFNTVLKKFAKQGEKTGWTYITVAAEFAQQLMPGKKTSFRVKGKIDAHKIAQVSLLPMGEGDFIIAVNADMRKGIKKPIGATVSVQLAVDPNDIEPPSDLIECFADEPAAKKYFESLTKGHQKYFIKWLMSAKTEATRIKRIAEMIDALSQHKGYPEMLRSRKDKV